MELNINSPAYYTQIFGVDDNLYCLCKELRAFLKDKQYSPNVTTIGFMPIVAPQSEIEAGRWKEIQKIDQRAKMVIISKHIDYDEFINADSNARKILLLNNLIDAINKLPYKLNFNSSSFKNDILEFTNLE